MRSLLIIVLLALPLKAVEPPTASAGRELPSYAASTAPITLDLISARFSEVDGRMKSLRAAFRQFARMDGSDAVQSVEGEVLFLKPDLLRLNHRLPEKQTVVCDGAWLWVYRESTNQVIQTRLESWRKSEPLAKGLLDFGRSADLLKRYAAVVSTVSSPGADGHRTFEVTLTPRPEDRQGTDADFELTLKASTRDFFPGDARLRVGRVSIHSVFEGVRLNPEFPAQTFRFAPPPGADVFQTPSPRP
ncbi:MAG: hypothetical protein A2X40_06400 [Elusimicrobia bacterium GWC2_65_9]|nr:MAG: hypothetical protein A2X37_08895 [Elusimicrobia bacterium GWA2_66_18]OGR72889.1 MAG: hypothetical protein A2X40_06400 [Elusimicrobia bacterium GWC2_65_9]